LTVTQTIVLKAVAACRTALLGGHVDACDHCGYRQPAYNSCRNRHCPKCQGAARAAWLEERRAELLPVPYFHVVFTLPGPIAPLALQNQAVVYDLLFRCAAETLQEIAADPKHLGARIGFLAVLHTWGQNLLHHPHVHCVIPGGGLSADGAQWIACRKNFFLPVRVLSRVFRGKFLAQLRDAFATGRLSFHGSLLALNDPVKFAQLLAQTYRTEWVVYTKPPAGGPEQVLKYLARYTYRVAIANERLLSLDEEHVTFRWKNYRRGGRPGTMTLRATEFIRRFLLHVLPTGFVRIRHYGFLCNRLRQDSLTLCRQLLGQHPGAVPSEAPKQPEADSRNADSSCPLCGHGPLRVVDSTPRPTIGQVLQSWPFNTS
jgi:Putative transposase/Transposase zinc-binding domain